MAVGIFIGLLAAKNGAKHVAVFTDTGHHDHPASACVDAFNPTHSRAPDKFSVSGAQFMLCNSPSFVGFYRPGKLAERLEMDVFVALPDNEIVRTKSWVEVLEILLKP